MDRQALALDLGRVDERAGQLVGHRDTELVELTPACFARTRIFVGRRDLPSRPLLVYFGHHDSGRAFLLTEQPDEFNRMVELEGPRLDDAEAALELALLFLDCTRPKDERFVVVRNVDELPWMPGQDPSQLERSRAEVSRHLAPPSVRADAAGWVIEAYAVHGRSLEVVTVNMTAQGRLSSSSRTLIAELPLSYVGG
jgi:hypothetical protein